MFKILTLGVLFFVLYRLIFAPSKRLESFDGPDTIPEEPSEIIDIDYEDVDP